MPFINFAVLEAPFGAEQVAAGSHFGILPSVCFPERLEVSIKRPELLDVLDKRFAVIRERQ
jgi:hypothetical protein